MSIIRNIYFKAITTIVVIAFLVSCEDNLKQVRKMETSTNSPIGEVTNMVIKHTDSTRLKLSIAGPVAYDYSNDAFPFTEFPNGVEVKVYEYTNNQQQVTTITANKAYLYDITDMIDMQGDVTIITHDGNTFNGDQLYWDQKNKWVFTHEPWETRLVKNSDASNLGNTSATMLDASEDLKKVNARNPNDTFISNQ
ncbi:hypothetical protein AAT17_09205 [Nonlabens sp. MIC269]|uniref:LPS export ABC transporter periplasmic protein LptC n=1 Tax=Nonlabens TaxID=363408 RepID=UPI0005AB5E57|nr:MULTISPECIES: LPS export ABC transporter periplasmic protein LptC [Nonlabens]ALM21394.1 hypothetical protein AAT17_09205 [Nonlabens sp. MIC269]MEE2801631.1 LPS export ABC transporter periplasmic protein LptC [Bacteroidota bacterium]